MEALYLCFPDKESAEELLGSFEGAIDIVGEINGVTGWHVNTRGIVTEELHPYAVTPATPLRTWL